MHMQPQNKENKISKYWWRTRDVATIVGMDRWVLLLTGISLIEECVTTAIVGSNELIFSIVAFYIGQTILLSRYYSLRLYNTFPCNLFEATIVQSPHSPTMTNPSFKD